MFQTKFKKEIPYLCTPIVGTTREELLEELDKIRAKEPDLIEWRVDFFQDIHDFNAVVEISHALKKVVPDIPLLLTLRSVEEGGNPTSLTKEEILKLLTYICKNSPVEMIDYEMANDEGDIRQVRLAAEEEGKLLILSYHDFAKTPTNDELISFIKKAEAFGADVAKLAVMPNNHGDVLRLLEVTEQARHFSKIPVATMSLNSLGAVSRMIGWIFGSVIVFTVGAKSSAPGQIPIEKMREILALMKDYQQA